MSKLGQFQDCTCQRVASQLSLCDGQYRFEEKGKKISCIPKKNEQVQAIQIDGCLITDNGIRCDGAFIWQVQNKAALLLVELKGASDIARAFEQLAYMKTNRQQYNDLKESIPTSQIIEKAFVVSNGSMSKSEKEKLENRHNIRVTAIIHSEATKAVPDLRRYF